MRTLAILSLLCGACFGLEVEPLQVRDTPIPIKHAKGVKVNAIFAKVVKGQVAWQQLPDKHFLRGDEMTVMVAPPGEYMVTVGGSKIVKVLEDGEPPRPDPFDEDEGDDGDDVTPDPDTTKLDVKWAIWVEEQDDRQKYPGPTSVMFDKSLRSSLESRGIKAFVLDEDQESAALYKSIIAKARERNEVDSLPVWILLAADKRRYKCMPAPTKLSHAEDLLRKHAK